MEASLRPGAVVTEVARRNQVSKSSLYEWRRLTRMGRLASEPAAPASAFVPVAIGQPAASEAAPAHDAPRNLATPRRRLGLIEIELAGGLRERADAQFDTEALGRVLDLLDWR